MGGSFSRSSRAAFGIPLNNSQTLFYVFSVRAVRRMYVFWMRVFLGSHDTKKQNAVLAMKKRKKYKNIRLLSLRFALFIFFRRTKIIPRKNRASGRKEWPLSSVSSLASVRNYFERMNETRVEKNTRHLDQTRLSVKHQLDRCFAARTTILVRSGREKRKRETRPESRKQDKRMRWV